jgi:hypothetical protein
VVRPAGPSGSTARGIWPQPDGPAGVNYSVLEPAGRRGAPGGSGPDGAAPAQPAGAPTSVTSVNYSGHPRAFLTDRPPTALSNRVPPCGVAVGETPLLGSNLETLHKSK